jgi:hypothetical protein
MNNKTIRDQFVG